MPLELSEIYYSIVIPLFNEEETLNELWKHLSKVTHEIGKPFEVIFVDDGSKDQSVSIMKDIANLNPEVKIVRLSRNFGHQCALAAGIEQATGQAVILMDGDLQDSPEAIPKFLEKWREGNEVVYAIREKRKEVWLKRAAFKVFYRLVQTTSSVPLPLDAGIFSLMDRQVVNVLRNMPERNRYITGLRAYAGFRQTGILVERGPRYSGQPRITLSKLFKLAFDGLFSFSTVPLRAITYFGFICALSSFAIGLVGLFFKLVLKTTFLSWQYGLTSTFFMGGVQLMCLGVIGEYISRIYDEVKQRPYYVIRDRINF